MGDLVYEPDLIIKKEIELVIKKLPTEKASGNDNIEAELLQEIGNKGMELRTSLINKMYKSGYIPEDFRKGLFLPVPKVELRNVVILEL